MPLYKYLINYSKKLLVNPNTLLMNNLKMSSILLVLIIKRSKMKVRMNRKIKKPKQQNQNKIR